MSTSKSKNITLRSSDGEEFVVDEAAALQSQTIKNMVEDLGSVDTAIPLLNVSARTLSKVVEYCKMHAHFTAHSSPTAKHDADADADEVKAFDTKFIMKLDQATLFDLIMAANYLNIRSLLDLSCQTVADMIKGKTPQEIRKIFHIKNDFTPKEEEEIRKENQWTFE